MKLIIQKYPKAFAAAVVLHVVFLLVFVITFDWTTAVDIEQEVNVVQATAIDESQVKAELDKLRAIEAAKRRAEQRRLAKLEKKADAAKSRREKEQEHIKTLEKQRAEEAEKKRTAELERQKAEAEREAAKAAAKQAEKERADLEMKRLHALAEKQKAEAEEKKAKAEAEKALNLQRKREEEELRQQMLAEEEKRLAALRKKKEHDEIQKYVKKIKTKINDKWIKPPGTKGFKTTVKVQIMPGGKVLSVKIVKSSGSANFDKNVELAVRKAAPLPLPPNAALYKHFRNLELPFTNK